MKLNFLQTTLATLFVGTAATQFCTSTDGDLSFCTSFTSVLNTSTQRQDLFIRYRAKTSQLDHGWTAFGAGASMSGALMFILWTDEKSDRVALSTRTAAGHSQPSTSSNLPHVDVISSSVSRANETLEVLFACYDFASWATLNDLNPAQPWIWARNSDQRMESLDPDFPIQYHQNFGTFFVDMTTVPRQTAVLDATELSDIIGTESSNAWNEAHVSGHSASSTTYGALFLGLSCSTWHGIVMIVACMVVLPVSHFTRHTTALAIMSWKPLYIGAAMASIGALIASVCADAKPVTLHQALGLGVVIALLACCCWEALVSQRSNDTTVDQGVIRARSTSFVWCEGMIVAAGVVNVGLGLDLAGASGFARLVYIVSVFAGTLGFAVLVHATSPRSREGLGQFKERDPERARLTAEETEEV